MIDGPWSSPRWRAARIDEVGYRFRQTASNDHEPHELSTTDFAVSSFPDVRARIKSRASPRGTTNPHLHVQGISIVELVLRERIELSTSPLPRECSTTELPQPSSMVRASGHRLREKDHAQSRLCSAFRFTANGKRSENSWCHELTARPGSHLTETGSRRAGTKREAGRFCHRAFPRARAAACVSRAGLLQEFTRQCAHPDSRQMPWPAPVETNRARPMVA
jgi:hypothetical protein